VAASPLAHLGAPWHTGIIVSDVEASMRDFSAATGCRWAVPSTVTPTIWTPHGEIDTTIVYTYSIGDEPRLELVVGEAGTPWDVQRFGGADHVCYWSDDIARDSAALDDLGFPLVATHAGGEGPRGFVYHASPVPGMRIELIDRARKPEIEAWLAQPPWTDA
jgi:hypothetical protein